MQKLLIGAAALALITGCNNSNTPASDTPADEPLKEISVRAGNPAMAADALAAMSLTDSGSGILAFGSKSVDGATATFNDVTFAGEDDVKIGSLVFEGLDKTDAGADFGKMSLNNIVISPTDEEAEVKLGSIQVTNPSPELAAWLTSVLDDGEPNGAFPAAEKLSFDSISLSGLTGNFDDADAEGTFGIDNFEIRGMGDLKAARASLSGVSLDVLSIEDNMPVKFNIGSINATNLDAKFVKAIQDNIGDEEALMSAIMAIAYDNPMDPGYDRITMDNLSADVGGAKFAIPSLDASVERNAAGQPVKYLTKPYTMSLTADADGELGSQLLQGLSVIGYESLELKGAGEASYDPDKDIVSFDAKSNYLELTDGATFRFGGKIEGYSAYSKQAAQSFDFADLAAGAEPDPMAMTEALGALTFHNFELSIKDDSLVNRVINAVATQSGQDPEQMKNQVAMGLGMAPMMAQGSGVDMALVTEAATALSNFITDPKTLTFKLAPSEPLSVAALMENPDPAALTKDTLGFSASNK